MGLTLALAAGFWGTSVLKALAGTDPASRVPDRNFQVQAIHVKELEKEGRFAEALSLCDRLLKEYGNAEAYVLRGDDYRMQEKFALAIDDFREADRLRPDDYFILNDLGAGYSKAGDYAKALEVLNQAMRVNAHFAPTYRNRGIAYASKGDNPSAIADFTTAIQLDPQNSAAYFWRGIAYAHARDLAKGRADYRKAVTLKPDLPLMKKMLEEALNPEVK